KCRTYTNVLRICSAIGTADNDGGRPRREIVLASRNENQVTGKRADERPRNVNVSRAQTATRNAGIHGNVRGKIQASLDRVDLHACGPAGLGTARVVRAVRARRRTIKI